MDLLTSRAAVASLLVVWIGWLLHAIVWTPDRFIVSPQPVHLTRQIVSLLIA